MKKEIQKGSFLFLFGLLLVACSTAPPRTSDSQAIVKSGASEMSPTEAKPFVEAAYSQFIDVRTPEEYAAGHAYRTRNIPLDKLMDNLGIIEKNEPVYLICATGRRSMEAAKMLNEAGYPQTISIAGGTAAWEKAGLPMQK
ncbi:MAG: rhodanese-like domain-containing protein [Acidobacteria bacterium]|nr:rhodanese-like domain-containing protein [Acidobacteriota bacterium]